CVITYTILTALCPLPFILQTDKYGLVIPAPERSVWIDCRMACAGAARFFTAVLSVVGRVAHPLPERFQHRYFKHCALTCFHTVHQCCQHAGICIHAGCDVSDGYPRFGGFIFCTCNGHETRL